MELASKLQKNKPWREISIALCDDREIRIVNQKHLARPETTDVITFSYSPLPGEKDGHSGEIIVNVQRAVESGSERGKHWSPSKELALYIAHGCDHLMDQEDRTMRERNIMRRRELRWLVKAKGLGLTTELVL